MPHNIPQFLTRTPFSSPVSSVREEVGNGHHRQAPENGSPSSPEESPAERKETLKPETPDWSTAVHSLLDQPPATFPQYLLVWGMVFSVVFGGWAWFGQIEDIGKAQGKLVPAGELYKVHPVELGKVTKLAVTAGEAVKAGQVLVELDPELSETEVERLEEMLHSYQVQQEQQQTLLTRLQRETQSRSAIATAEVLAQSLAVNQAQSQVSTQRQLLFQLRSEQTAQRERQARLQPVATIAQQQLAQLEAEIVAHQERIAKLQPLQQEGAISQEYVFQAEQALRQTRQQYMQLQLQNLTQTDEQIFQADQSLRELETRIQQNQGNLAVAVKEAEKLQAGLTQKQAEQAQIQSETERQIQQLEMEITQLEGKITEAENQLVTARTRLKQRFLKAPVDGTILSLNLDNIGEVVQPGETLAEIAPQGSPLLLSALLPNQDAGFVKEGMPVKVKLDAYPFQDYGLVAGTVTAISPNTQVEPGLGAVYQVEIELERNHVTEAGDTIQFKPGQTAIAEIIIRRRRIVDVLLDPFRQLHQDGINL